MVHQQGVDHRGFIDDQKVAIQRRIPVLLESSFPPAVFEQAMDGLGLMTGGLHHPLGGPSGGGGQQDPGLDAGEDPDECVDDGRLARPGASRDDHHLVFGQASHGLDLLVGKDDPELFLNPLDGFSRVNLSEGPGGVDDRFQTG